MIGFFRRIRKKLADDNQILKYSRYAIGEIVLVMVGILLALQVNNWNEERKNITKEKHYLNSIKLSIEMSQKEFDRVIGDAEHIASCADTLFMTIALGRNDLLTDIVLDSLLYGAGNYSLISINDGGIQEVLSTGNLNIIRSEDIRVFLASWNNNMHEIRKFERETEYLSRNYNEFLNNYLDIKRFVSNPHESMVVPSKKAQLISDPQLTNHLIDIAGMHRVMERRYQQERASLDSLTFLINSYMDK